MTSMDQDSATTVALSRFNATDDNPDFGCTVFRPDSEALRTRYGPLPFQEWSLGPLLFSKPLARFRKEAW